MIDLDPLMTVMTFILFHDKYVVLYHSSLYSRRNGHFMNDSIDVLDEASKLNGPRSTIISLGESWVANN